MNKTSDEQPNIYNIRFAESIQFKDIERESNKQLFFSLEIQFRYNLKWSAVPIIMNRQFFSLLKELNI